LKRYKKKGNTIQTDKNIERMQDKKTKKIDSKMKGLLFFQNALPLFFFPFLFPMIVCDISL
jgi:hypothetical protein